MDEKSSDRVARFVTQINDGWRKSTELSIENALECAKAKDELRRNELIEVKKQLTMGDSYFSKHVRVGQNPFLTNPQNRHLLPASIGTLYELSQMSEADLEKAKAKKDIRPDMQRAGAEQLRTSRKSRAAGAKETLFCVLLNGKLNDQEKAVLEEAINKIRSCSSLSVAEQGPYDKIKSAG